MVLELKRVVIFAGQGGYDWEAMSISSGMLIYSCSIESYAILDIGRGYNNGFILYDYLSYITDSTHLFFFLRVYDVPNIEPGFGFRTSQMTDTVPIIMERTI